MAVSMSSNSVGTTGNEDPSPDPYDPHTGAPMPGGDGELSYEENLEAMYRAMMKDYEENVLPLIELLEQEAVSTETVDRAMRNASMIEQNSQEVNERQEQYSSSSLLPSMEAAQDTNISRNATLAGDSMVSSAEVLQRDQHAAARADLNQISENLMTTGVAGMSQVQMQQEQRDAEAAAQSANMMSTIGGVVGGVVGMVGGPAGSAAGAAIGGGIGSQLG